MIRGEREFAEMPRYVSVDVEASGPIPGDFSLLSIGACFVEDTNNQFYVELKPISLNFNDAAIFISGLNLKALTTSGEEPRVAMEKFEDWLKQIQNPIMIGYSTTFDWMFICYYFHHFLGRNPLGHSAIDMKALYMGAMNCDWKIASKKSMSAKMEVEFNNTHNALEDAIEQAKLFSAIIRR